MFSNYHQWVSTGSHGSMRCHGSPVAEAKMMSADEAMLGGIPDREAPLPYIPKAGGAGGVSQQMKSSICWKPLMTRYQDLIGFYWFQ